VTVMKFRPRRPSVGTVIALIALFVALGGPAQAAKLINGKLIKPGTIRSTQVKNRSLSTADLSSAAVRSLMRTPAASIRAAEIAPGSITGDRLAASSVNGATVADDSLTAADLAAGAVTNSELANSAVTRSKIATNGVGSSEITSSAVGSSEVADGTLTGADVGVFTGTFTAQVPAVAQGNCVSAPDVEVAPVVAGADLTKTAIVATPDAAWPDDLVYTVRAIDASHLRVTVCAVGQTLTVNPSAQAFRYVAFAS
jgi:hypothetical protein